MENSKNPVDPLMFKLMVDQTKDYALFLLDPQGRIMSWNLGAQLIKGYYRDEIIGRHFSVFYTADAIATGWPQHELERATAEGRFEDEGWRIRKDGSRMWASVIITALRDDNGTLLGFSKITRDLTDRKAHEESLRQTEERFRLLVEGVAEYAIYMLDIGGIVTSWNAGAERIKGYTREEIVGKHFSRFYKQEDIEAGRPWRELATARHTGRAEDEGWRLKKSGEPFWARVVVSALYDENGHLRGFAKVTQDLTERRHVMELEKAAQNVSEFIATLAHEIRNPLAPIRSAVQVMATLPAGHPGHAAMRDMIDRQSNNLARIVDDMIDVSRISRGVLAIERVPVDISELIKCSVEAAAPLMEAAKHTLEIEWPAQPLFVKGDLGRLTQLLTNLLSNAARYTPEGGRVRVTGQIDGSSAAVHVRDTGRGIDAQMIESIFDMFVQGHGVHGRAGRGLGIGLALARKIAELHGGSLQARSEGENKGAEFIVRIPLLSARDDSADQYVHTPPAQAVQGVTRRVLIVDDNVDAAVSMDMLLKSMGHETRVAHDGTEALTMTLEFSPDIILLDIGMPGLDGYEVARRLRKLKNKDQLRIVAVTGWGQEFDRKKSKDAGFDIHLLKPVELDQLLMALNDNDNGIES